MAMDYSEATTAIGKAGDVYDASNTLKGALTDGILKTTKGDFTNINTKLENLGTEFGEGGHKTKIDETVKDMQDIERQVIDGSYVS